MGEAKAVLKKKKKKLADLDERVEEIESLIEEDDFSADEDTKTLLKRINTVLEALLRAAEESEDELILQEIHDDVKELKERIGEGLDKEVLERIEKKLYDIESILEKRISDEIRDLQRTNADFLSDLKKDLSDIKESIGLLLKEEEKRLELLEKELESIKTIINGIHAFLDGDTERRREFLSEIRESLEALDSELKEISQRLANDKTAKLQEDLQKMKDAVLYAISKLEDLESRHAEAFSHSLDELREELEKLTKELTELEQRESIAEESLKQLEDKLTKSFKKVRTLVKVTSKNSHLLEKYGGELAGIMTTLHALQEKLKEMSEKEKVREEMEREYLQKLFEHIDESLADLSKKIGDILLESAKERDKTLDTHIKGLEESLKDVHSELANLLLLLRERDPTSELKELEEQMKLLSERVEKGIMDKKEIREALESIEKRLDDIEQSIPSEDLHALKKILKEVEEHVELMEKKIESAGAVLSKEDLKDILKEIEELRLQARLLKTSGISESLEELSKRVEEFKKELEELPEEAVHVGESMKKVEELLEEVVKLASQIETVAKEKARSSEKMAKYAEKVGEHAGVVGSHIIKKKSSSLKKKSKVMMEIASIARKISKRTQKLKEKLEEKRVRPSIETTPPEEKVKRILISLLKSMKPGEVIDLKSFARERGYSYDLVKEVAEEIVKVGEMAVKLEKPIIPFLGSWKLRRL